MTAGTVVITGGILATVILLCIIAILCYCRLQYYCCKKEESESEEEEPDFAVTSRGLPPVHSNHNIVAASHAAGAASSPLSDAPNGPAAPAAASALFSTPPLARKLTRSQTFCPSCTHYELPFYLQPPPPPPQPPPPVHHHHHHQYQHHQPLPPPHPEAGLMLRNGGERISYRSVQQQDVLEMPMPVAMPPSTLMQELTTSYRKHNQLPRSATMRDMFARSCSISTDV